MAKKKDVKEDKKTAAKTTAAKKGTKTKKTQAAKAEPAIKADDTKQLSADELLASIEETVGAIMATVDNENNGGDISEEELERAGEEAALKVLDKAGITEAEEEAAEAEEKAADAPLEEETEEPEVSEPENNDPQDEQPEEKEAGKPGKTKVLFASFEAGPFVKTGGLGDVAGSLPAAVNNSKFDVRVIMPKLKQIPDEYVDKMKYITNFYVPLGWRSVYCGLFSLKYNGVTFYFLDNERYFYRDKVYGEFDDGERAAFYSKAVLESIMYLPNFVPDIIHANDWHAGLVPVFLREHYQMLGQYRNIKTIYTIHNLKFQGKFSETVINDICGLGGTPAARQLLSDRDTANYLQGGAIYADWVTTVSPNYANEICNSYFGEELEWLFAKRRGNSLSGILNGIDVKAFDPENDEAIDSKYNEDSIELKTRNKLALQRELGLKEDPEIPLFVVISRLTEQKGLDLITYKLPQIIEANMQLAILGVGEYHYEEAFGWYSYRHPDKIAFRKEFNNDLSHRMYAGADVVLVPSRFEPCGLTQMIAMRYGALPLVRETGGLYDSVCSYYIFNIEYDEYGQERVHDNRDIANGFSFANYNADEFISKVYQALKIWFDDRNLWKQLQKNAMKADFSWTNSAKEYRKLYDLLLGK